jgi:hypothetical protein
MENKLEMSFIAFVLVCLLFGYIGWYYGSKTEKEKCLSNANGSSSNGTDPTTITNNGGNNGSNVVVSNDNTIYGCTDATAINYYAGAAADDGSCIYNV